MHNLSISELVLGLKNKDFSSQELTQHFVDRINKYDSKLNSFITVNESLALEQAKQADKLIAANKSHTLTGIPIAQKDIFCTQGIKTTCGSKMLDNFIAPYNATIIKKFNDAGAVLLGKTNMDEFAMGSSNENSYYGPVNNPWDTSRVPGGSSGGSAAVVGARLAPGATGTDTGGSIRQPASFCNATGMKPTYGRVSRFGMVAFASSLDQGGPITSSAEDAALMLNVMSGFDENDSTSINEPVPDYQNNINKPIKDLTIGLPKEFFSDKLDNNINSVIQTAIKQLEQLGVKFKEISLPRSPLAVPAYYVIAPAECSSNLSRYDGVRYGYRCENPKNLNDLYFRSRSDGFGDEVKRRIMVGTYALSSGYYDAYYDKAQKIRRLIKNDFHHAFQNIDLILGPTAPSTAFKLNEKTNDHISMYLSDIYTIAVNLAGLPAISIPAGFSDNLPVGLQLIGNYLQEELILNVAHQYQQETDWHKQIPKEFKD